MCGVAWRHTERHISLNVLDYYDGVIHHDTHSQHQSEQRQVVDGTTAKQKDRESADKRDWDSDNRDNSRPPVLQKDIDDADYEGDRNEDRLDHLIDGLADEGGRIVKRGDVIE